MKRTHLAIGIVGIAITLAAEIPACHRIVFRAVHRHHSKATLASWAEWNKTHVLPKPKEILAELDFACPPVDLTQIDTGDFIPAEVVPTWEPVEIESDVTVATASSVGLDYEVPSGFVLIYPVFFGITFQPGTYVVTEPQPVPEPWSVVLVGLGLLGIRKRRV